MIYTSGDLKKKKSKFKDKLKTHARCDKPTIDIPSTKPSSILQKWYGGGEGEGR